MSASLVEECYRRACDAKRSAEMASMPSEKTHFLELEQRWLRAASTVAPKTPSKAKAIVEPKIANVRKRTPSKFTPERLEQIRDLVALGKSREEIAELLRVTVGTLQVATGHAAIAATAIHNGLPRNLS
jgi:DNA-binding NarL/FixJ family response regulator